MREVDANVEIGDGFCVVLVVYTAPMVMVSVLVPVNYTSAAFSVGPIDVQGKGRRVGGVRE